MRRVLIFAAFGAVAFIDVFVVLAFADVAAGGDVGLRAALGLVAALAPAAALGWLVWRELKPPTAESLNQALKRERLRRRCDDLMIDMSNQGPVLDRLVARNRRAAALLGRDADKAFDVLTAEAEASARRGERQAYGLWRDLGALVAGFDDERSIAALMRANHLNSKDDATLHFLQRRYIATHNWDEARRAGAVGASLVRSDLGRVLFLNNDAWICFFTVDWHGMAGVLGALADMLPNLKPDALASAAYVLSDLEGAIVEIPSGIDFVDLRATWLAIVRARRALVARGYPITAKADLAKSLTGAGEALVARAGTEEGRALIAEGQALAQETG